MMGVGWGGGGASSAQLDTLYGSTRGMMLRRGASLWEAFSVGAANRILASDGTDPNYATLTSLIDTLSSTNGHILNRSGGSWTGSTFQSLLDANVAASANDLLYYSGGTWTSEGLSTVLDNVIGSTRGDTLVRGSSGWQRLALPAVGGQPALLGSNGLDLTAVGGRFSVGVQRTAAQSLSTDTFTPISFDTQNHSYGSMHSLTTNPTRVTFPVAGRYLFTGYTDYAANTTNNRQTAIRYNGTTYKGVAAIKSATALSTTAVFFAAIIDTLAGDYAELVGYQDSTASLDVTARLQVALLPGL